jgi:hypothetical protein
LDCSNTETRQVHDINSEGKLFNNLLTAIWEDIHRIYIRDNLLSNNICRLAGTVNFLSTVYKIITLIGNWDVYMEQNRWV